MQNKVFRFYTELPPWAKGVVVVGGVIAASFVTYKVYRLIFPSESEKKNRELSKNIDSEILNHSRKGLKASYADSNYNTFANTIYNSMRYAVGDDYGTVEVTLKKMKNDIDVAKLIKAFGQRQDYAFGIPIGHPLDLFTYVQKELGNDFGGLTNYRVKSINADWKKKGINYQL